MKKFKLNNGEISPIIYNGKTCSHLIKLLPPTRCGKECAPGSNYCVAHQHGQKPGQKEINTKH